MRIFNMLLPSRARCSSICLAKLHSIVIVLLAIHLIAVLPSVTAGDETTVAEIQEQETTQSPLNNITSEKTEPHHPETTPGLPGTTEPAPTPAPTQPPATDAKSDDLTTVHISEHLTEAAKPTDGEKELTTADSKSVTSITGSPDDGGHSTATTTRNMFTAFAPVTGTAQETTKNALATTVIPLDVLLPVKHVDELSEEEVNGVVTILFDSSKETVNNQFIVHLDEKLRPALATAINSVIKSRALETTTSHQSAVTTAGAVTDNSVTKEVTSPSIARARRDAATPDDDQVYGQSDIWYVDTPTNKDDVLQLSVYASKNGAVLPQSDLLQAVHEIVKHDTLGLDLVAAHAGMPIEAAAVGASQAGGDVRLWDTHPTLFLVIIILLCLCVIISLAGLAALSLVCCSRSSKYTLEKQPIDEESNKQETAEGLENPVPDVEIVQDEAPVVNSQPPAPAPVTPSDDTRGRPFWRLRPLSSHSNGKNAAKAEEESGWIVPMDQVDSSEFTTVELKNL